MKQITCPRCQGEGIVEERLTDILLIRRQQMGLSQAELAHRSGVSRTMLSMIETGKTNPSQRTLEKIVQVLGGQLTVEFKEV